MINETVYCEFGCSQTLDACKQSNFLITFIVIIIGVLSFISLIILEYPFNMYAAIFYLVIATTIAPSDIVSGVPRIITILYILIYISFIIIKLSRGNE
ncbi:MAG: hypothetical protein QXG39_02520 [Candidatus Aenigmatarchaeota archaeon]